MPAYDIDSQSPGGGSFEHQPGDHWSMPVGRIAGIRFFVSYSVFVALAVLAGLVALLAARDAGRDLPPMALMSVAIWIIGWSVQLIVHLALHFGSTAKSDSITIGLLGIEVGNPLTRRYPWSALANLSAALLSLGALVLFGVASLAIHLASQGLSLLSWEAVVGELSLQNSGFGTLETGFLTATWLLWIQAACQAYPLPRNLGRGAIASAVAMFSEEANDEFQVRLLRSILQFIAIVTLLVATAAVMALPSTMPSSLPVLIVLSVYLWFTSRNQDVRDWITSVHLADEFPGSKPTLWAAGPLESEEPSTGTIEAARRSVVEPVGEWVESFKMRGKRKQARAVMMREREEASDAARLDEVLERVSKSGIEGLNADDKALLNRVSANLQHHRQKGEPEAE